MSFVSKNPMYNNNPEVGEGATFISSEKLEAGAVFIGYFKHKYIDKTYGKENYVIKDAETGKDILFYGNTCLQREFSFYDIGSLLKLTYKGKIENKGGRFKGKSSHIWEILMDSSNLPSQAFVHSLQQEVAVRRQQVLGSNVFSESKSQDFKSQDSKFVNLNKNFSPFGE